MIIAPKIRGFICTTAHPEGCAQHIAEQIAVVKSRGPIANGPKKVLVIGSSTGYGLSSRIAAAFGCGADTMGVFFEKPAEEGRCGTAGWYNSAAFEKEAAAAGLFARSFNGDAFSDAMKAEVCAAIKADFGQVDCIIYSLASPRRTDPKTGEVYKSVLKSIGESYTNKNLNTGNGVVDQVTIQPAEGDDIKNTVAVMGGEDWEMWIDALLAENLIAPGTQTVAYSYIGPDLTWAIYARCQTFRPRRQSLGFGQQSPRHPSQLGHSRGAALHFLALQGDESRGHARGHHRADGPPVARSTLQWQPTTR